LSQSASVKNAQKGVGAIDPGGGVDRQVVIEATKKKPAGGGPTGSRYTICKVLRSGQDEDLVLVRTDKESALTTCLTAENRGGEASDIVNLRDH